MAPLARAIGAQFYNDVTACSRLKNEVTTARDTPQRND